MVTEKFIILMVTYMKVNGKMTCFIKKVNMSAKMDIFMMVNGMKEKSKEKESKAGKMDRFTLVSLKMALKMVGESWVFEMEAIMKDSLPQTR